MMQWRKYPMNNSGTPREEAIRFVEKSDLYNARYVLENSLEADMNLRLQEDGSYAILTSV